MAARLCAARLQQPTDCWALSTRLMDISSLQGTNLNLKLELKHCRLKLLCLYRFIRFLALISSVSQPVSQ
jgi:hypothetical protein